MENADADALVAWGGANFHYLSGFQNYFDNPGASIAVLPRSESAAPFLVVANWVEVAARAASWIEEVHAFPLWLEIFEQADLDGGKQSTEKPLRFDVAKNLDLLARLLAERGLAGGRIAIERGVISAAAFEMLAARLPRATWIDATSIFFELRSLKRPEEIQLLRRATEYAEHGLRTLTQLDLVGADVAALRHLYTKACAELALERRDSEFHGVRVTASVGGDVSPVVTGGRRAQGGDLIFFDCGALVDGYGSDTGRTFSLGPPAPRATRVMDALRAGVEAALRMIAPGVPMCDVFHAGQDAVRNAGLDGYSRGHVGHTMGLGAGEMPPFLSPAEKRPLEESMVIAIETPLYVRGLGGFQIEECVVVTASGYELLTSLPRSVIEVASA
jgi:Xaa-Pro aminopeptidase